MERFKIYVYTNLINDNEDNSEKTLITDSKFISSASTYDETFSLSENGQANLSFKIMEKLPNGDKNPFLDVIRPESILGLHLPDREKNTENKDFRGAYYKFKVKTRTPSLSEENTVYSITAVDYARAVYSHQAEGFEYESTGTLRELAEDILGSTRKNVAYADLNRDISEMFVDQFHIQSEEKKGFKYSLPYVNYEQTDMNVFKNNMPYVTFKNNKKMKDGGKYDMHLDVVSSLFKGKDKTEPLDFRIGVRGISKSGRETFSDVTGKVINFEKAVSLRFPFTFRSPKDDETDRIELTINEIKNNSDGSSWPVKPGTFSISITNFKITKSRSYTEEILDNTALKINHLSNFKDFMDPDKGIGAFTKMTISLQNSNLYSALVDLATLFEAEVRFDYIENAFYFVSKKKRRYKGYKLHPEINLETISRPESSEEFVTILHIEGDGDIDGAMPPMPQEWRRFLSECVDNNFSNDEYFKNYNRNNKFVDYIDKVYSYRDKEDSEDERRYEIEKFAKHMDKIPNFESTIYDFSYFNEIGDLGVVGSKDYYTELLQRLYDDVRKLNISLNINTYRYYLIYSAYVRQLSQISFYVGLINTEEKLIYNTEQKLDENNPNAPQIYTSAWVSYMNAIDSAKANIANYKEELYGIMGIDKNGDLDTKSGSFVYNSCMLFGYKDDEDNGIQKLLDENAVKINQKVNEREEALKKVAELEKELEDPATTTFLKESINVEIAGLRSQLDTITNYLGRPGGNRGAYIIESGFYGEIKSKLKNKKIEINEDFLKSGKSLFKLLFDRESEHNLLNHKEKALELLMDKYEPFAIEGRYQNSDEVDASGLLEQGLEAAVKFSRPKISYNISSIHIGALEEYKYYKHPEIGDKVLLHEDLYKTYHTNEETNYIIIVGYDEKLREFSSVKLSVETDDESELLVRKMLEETNFIKVGESKTKSSYTVPVPAELKEEIGSVEESINTIKDLDLSVSDMFDKMLIK